MGPIESSFLAAARERRQRLFRPPERIPVPAPAKRVEASEPEQKPKPPAKPDLHEIRRKEIAAEFQHSAAHGIIAIVANAFGLSIVDILRRTTRPAVSHPRQLAMFLIRERFPGMSYPRIARLFRMNDHTTVVHGCQSVRRRIENSQELAERVRIIREEIAERLAKREEASEPQNHTEHSQVQ